MTIQRLQFELCAGPLLVDESALPAIERIAKGEKSGLLAKPAEIERQGDLAIIPITGLLVPGRAGLIERLFGATGYQDVADSVNGAARDDDIKRILLMVDSPGGTVQGVTTASDAVAEAAKIKPVVAHTTSMMASGAYWIGSQANTISADRMSDIGSIGVISVRLDLTGAYQQRGIKLEVYRSGPLKATGVAGESLSEEQAQHLQRRIDEIFAAFLGAVESRRGRMSNEVRSGASYLAEKALNLGLIDSIGTVDSVISGAGAARVRASKPVAEMSTDEALREAVKRGHIQEDLDPNKPATRADFTTNENFEAYQKAVRAGFIKE